MLSVLSENRHCQLPACYQRQPAHQLSYQFRSCTLQPTSAYRPEVQVSHHGRTATVCSQEQVANSKVSQLSPGSVWISDESLLGLSHAHPPAQTQYCCLVTNASAALMHMPPPCTCCTHAYAAIMHMLPPCICRHHAHAAPTQVPHPQSCKFI